MIQGKGANKRDKTRVVTAAALAGIVLLVVLGYLPSWLGASGWRNLLQPPQPRTAGLTVHFIDVGQGDSILIQAQGEAMLIDGGERGQEETVIRYLREQGIKELRYVIATHPHSDHMGGLAYGVLEAFPIREVIAPRLPENMMPTTRTYETFLKALAKIRQEQGTLATPAQPGQTHRLGEAEFTILGPLADSEEMNNYSVAIRLQYGSSAVLLTGDAEKEAEALMTEHWGTALDADLLKAGHHGSKTSTGKKLLEAVTPENVVICCGVDNSYNHPHVDTLARLAEYGIAVFRTDLDGTVVFCSDGKVFWKEEKR